jgi:heme/copper-type cytochrome/quinol oxidase subunit 2
LDQKIKPSSHLPTTTTIIIIIIITIKTLNVQNNGRVLKAAKEKDQVTFDDLSIKIINSLYTWVSRFMISQKRF